MNIYISPKNEELLRKYDGSMSGLVNRLLAGFFEENPAAATGVRREVDKRDEVPPVVPTHSNPFSEPHKQSPQPATQKYCKHGAVPEFCKHARPGKPCK